MFEHLLVLVIGISTELHWKRIRKIILETGSLPQNLEKTVVENARISDKEFEGLQKELSNKATVEKVEIRKEEQIQSVKAKVKTHKIYPTLVFTLENSS